MQIPRLFAGAGGDQEPRFEDVHGLHEMLDTTLPSVRLHMDQGPMWLWVFVELHRC